MRLLLREGVSGPAGCTAGSLTDRGYANRRQREGDPKSRPGAGAGAGHLNPAAMISHNSMDDRKPKARPLARGTSGKKWLKEMLLHFGSQAIAIIGKNQNRLVPIPGYRNVNFTISFDRVKGIHHQVENNLLQ